MPSAANIDKFRILSGADDCWTVAFHLPEDELVNQQLLLTHLRGVKRHISEIQAISEHCLLFDGIVRKTNHDRYVDVVVRVRKLTIPSGAPRVTFTDEELSADTRYTHMHAFLGAFYIDEFGDVISRERVLQAIRSAGVVDDLVDHTLIDTTVREILASQREARDIPIAHGKLPGTSKDAEVVFFFQAVGDSNNVDLLYSARRARKGDLLCRKTPPLNSTHAGINVLGERLPPKSGFDINLIAGAQSTLSVDGLNIVADCDGIVVVSRATRRIQFGREYKEVPDSVKVRVDPILKIDANELTEVVTANAVEVTGNLRVGTRIISEGEVFVNGNVEAGVNITASDDILVKGNVTGATLSSQTNIVVSENIASSNIHARGDVNVSGSIVDSHIDGDSVTATSVTGGDIVARRSVTLKTVGEADEEIVTTICVGASEFYEQRLQENQRFIESANSNLERIRVAIGDEIFESVSASNTHVMYMKLLTKLRLGRNHNVQSRIEVYRQLIDAVIPTKALVEQKQDECVQITERIAEQNNSEDSSIVVMERFFGRVVVRVDSVQGVVEKMEHGAVIRVSNGALTVNRMKWKLAGP